MAYTQQIEISGDIRESGTNQVLVQVAIRSVQSGAMTNSDERGRFTLPLNSLIQDTLVLEMTSFEPLQIPIGPYNENADLGSIYMVRDREVSQIFNLIELDNESFDENPENDMNMGLLRSTRDLLSRRAAFDLGQAFFRLRGYDAANGVLLINGMPMNRMLRGQPQWNNWGGLNDVFREQETSIGLEASPWHFGGLLGTTYIDSRPGTHRNGLSITTSLSNKTYMARIMATFSKTPDKRKLGYTFSASARWGESGFIVGTGYEAFSAYTALEYNIGHHSSIYCTALLASNIRGASAAITEEVYELKGRTFNPYWGIQSTKKRNSRIRRIEEPMILINYRYKKRSLFVLSGIGFQWGSQSRSRLGYYNAPNPQSDYYRYLPSYSINNSFGPNLIAANETKEAFIENSQINWDLLYEANRSSPDGKAHYILYDDVSNSNILRSHLHLQWNLGDFNFIDFGSTFTNTRTKFYAQINDLLGAEYHEDSDPFSDTLNDIQGSAERYENDVFGYNYQIESSVLDAFLQFRFTRSKWSAFVSTRFYLASYQRHGFYQNGKYQDHSTGPGERLKFSNIGGKASISYVLTSRHRLVSHGAYFFRAPVLSNSFINPRENHQSVPGIRDEKVSSIDINYHFQLPKLSGRITSYYTRFQDASNVTFFYVDSGVGSDFVQQVLTGVDRLHKGIEVGLIYKPVSSVSVSVAGSISEFLYASDPQTSINFDTSGPEEDLIDVTGTIDLGSSKIKDHKIGRGPSHALSLGIDYRDPGYWWMGLTFNYLAENYIQISPITRTESFKLNPESGKAYENATDENVSNLLAQRPLEAIYLVNLNAGKSWKIKDLYLGLFLSVSNLLDTTYKSGGYEQSRNGNFGQLYQDNISGSPSFGPKYWFGYGRTFFLNLSLSI